jgi:hypothetical protein
VSKDSRRRKRHLVFHYVQIGVAYPARGDLDEGLALALLGLRHQDFLDRQVVTLA